jgi:DNA-binding CsgD family transcriptional regulator
MKERVRKLLDTGVPRIEIAARLGVSPSTVTRYSRLLGYPDARRRHSVTDWRAIQEYYDEGHTIDECRDRFGFSYGAWDKAAVRGNLIPRSRRHGELGQATRDRVESLISEGLTQIQIARQLGLTKSTVAYHERKLGRRADVRFATRYDWAEVQRAIDTEGLSMKQCLARFGFCSETWRQAVERGAVVPRPAEMPLEMLLVRGRRQTNRTHLKNRLLKAGLKESRCEQCGLTHWQGKPLNVQLHHANGERHDNRLSNIVFLCPNCHSQTANWGGRNGHRRRRATEDGAAELPEAA